MFWSHVNLFLFIYEAVTQVQFALSYSEMLFLHFLKGMSVCTTSIRTSSLLTGNLGFLYLFCACCGCRRSPYFYVVTGAVDIWRDKGASCLNLLNLMAPRLHRRIISTMCLVSQTRCDWPDSGGEWWAILGAKSGHSAALVNRVPCSVILASEMSKVLLSVRTDRDESSFGNFSSVIHEPQKGFRNLDGVKLSWLATN